MVCLMSSSVYSCVQNNSIMFTKVSEAQYPYSIFCSMHANALGTPQILVQIEI